MTVKLAQPEADWPLRLGYSAFMPLPADAIKDPKKYGENPVGNGPYKMEKEGAWQHDSQIALVKNPDYKGAREAKNGGVTFKFYTDPAPAYTDIQANNLDVTDVLPTNALKTFTIGLPGEQPEQAVRRQLHPEHPGLPARVHGRSRPAAPPGTLHGDQPRRDHQGHLLRHPHPGQGLHAPRPLTATTKTLPVPRS